MSQTLTATGPLLRFAARRDRVKLSIWVLGLGAFVPYMMTAYKAVFATPEDLAPLAILMANPSLTLFTGPGFGLRNVDPTELTHQIIFASVYWLYLLIFVALMNILLVSRHTRLEEQTGRAELVRASVVGRLAPLTSALLLALGANVAVGGLVALGLIGFGSDASSSLLLGAGTTGLGLVFAGVAMVTSQVSAFSAAGSGLAGGVLAAAWVVRGVGDMAAGPDEYGTWVSWLSPLAWAQQTRAFHDDRWWPVALLLVTAALLMALGYAVAARRDLGAGLVEPRRGRATAASWLRGPVTLAWRLQRTQTLWWAIALTLAAAMYGSFTPAMVEAFEELPDIFQQLMGGSGVALEGYLTLTVTMMRITVAIYAVVAWQRVAAEEVGGRAEPVLATDVRPASWLAGHLAVVAGASVVLLLLTGALAGYFAAGVDGDYSLVADGVAASAVGIPSVLMVLGLAVALHAVAPRLVVFTWIPVVAGALIELFGDMLQFPDWLRQISPFEHTPALPAEELTAAPLVVQVSVAVGLVAFGLWKISHRDIPGH
jgi:ABC-2 type transport system permease protein